MWPPNAALGLIFDMIYLVDSFDSASSFILNSLFLSGNGGASGSVQIASDTLYSGKCWKKKICFYIGTYKISFSTAYVRKADLHEEETLTGSLKKYLYRDDFLQNCLSKMEQKRHE